MTKTQQQRIALALLKARPPVIPGSNVVANETARKVWHNCCTQIALALPLDQPGKLQSHHFFNIAGVPE